MKEVTIYTTDYCPYCNRVKSFFDSLGVEYRQVDLTNDPDARQALVERTKLKTVPQVFVGELLIGGHDDTVALHKKGELMPLIEAV